MTEPGPERDPATPDAGSGTVSYPSRREVQHAYRKAHRHPWLRRGSIVLASGLVLLLVLGGLAFYKLNSNINKIDVSSLLGKRPNVSTSADKVTGLQPLNILVMGVDDRNLGTTKYGYVPGSRSDTNLLVHLSGDRKSATVVSIPRDSMLHAPADCSDPNSVVMDGPIRMFNENFGRGGPACVMRTFMGNTDINIDHFMVVNFLSFQSMVDALGSVEVCLPEAVNDPKSHLKLPAGRSEVSGDQALSFVRARYNFGNDASDILRIGRQQAFLSAMVQQVTSSDTLLRPDKLFRFMDAATKGLTTDQAMDLNAMRDVAQSVAGLKAAQIRFVTVPNEPYPPNHMRVQWTPEAKVLWKSLHDDTPLPGTTPPPGSTTTPAKSPAGPPLTVTPDKFTVDLHNASGVTGRALQAADDLRLQGFNIGATSTSTTVQKGVTVAYSTRYLQEARTVAAAFPGAKLVKDESAAKILQVTLGTGSPDVVLVPNRMGNTPLPKRSVAATPSPGVTIKARTADSNLCSK